MRALLINPWICDFSAYDLWACPLGLLSLGALLRAANWDVDFTDITSRSHPALAGRKPPADAFNAGKYYATEIPKPSAVAWVPRRFKRYGIPPEAAEESLRRLSRPDIILVTSRMTYWYPGVAETIALCRAVFPGVPIVLGGIYATLCASHARSVCRPDVVYAGEGERGLAELIGAVTGSPLKWPPPLQSADFACLDNLPVPAYDLLPSTAAAAIETSRGCPCNCSYCSTPVRYPGLRKKSSGKAADEIEYAYTELGTQDFAFYDDALLADADHHFSIIAREIIRRGIHARFHAPNGLFASMISESVADLMKNMGVETVRVSLESADAQRLNSWNRRVTPSHFARAMANLQAAGFRRKQLGVYLLCGMPGQTLAEVKDAISLVADHGGTPRLCEYSPIPGTAEWERACANTSLPLEAEPLLQNNTIYGWAAGGLSPEIMSELKNFVRTKLAGVSND